MHCSTRFFPPARLCVADICRAGFLLFVLHAVAVVLMTAWLALNRDGLTVFTHAETGDVMADHTDHVVWLGESQPLRLEVLREILSR